MFPADINVNNGDFAGKGHQSVQFRAKKTVVVVDKRVFNHNSTEGGLAIQIVNESRNAAGEPSLSEKHLCVVGQLEFRALLIVLRQLF